MVRLTCRNAKLLQFHYLYRQNCFPTTCCEWLFGFEDIPVCVSIQIHWFHTRTRLPTEGCGCSWRLRMVEMLLVSPANAPCNRRLRVALLIQHRRNVIGSVGNIARIQKCFGLICFIIESVLQQRVAANSPDSLLSRQIRICWNDIGFDNNIALQQRIGIAANSTLKM